ncbi:RES domain-containing protein [Skermanella aerolata]|uniref:RES family NAD+ phosphorylase n=1 Tax=Skermanella aerolata TaxID=393310 RepID=UPI003D21DC96
MIVWRLSRFTDLQGIGGLHVAGRWHTKGHSIVYAAASASTALLEIMFHLDIDQADIPDSFKLIEIAISDEIALSAEKVRARDLILTDEHSSREFDTRWLKERRSALLLVPSIIVPVETNVLINPDHPDAHKIEVIGTSTFVFDERLLRVPAI